MKILIAPDSFKECLPAWQAAIAIERGVKRVRPDAVCFRLPMADGGEGTMDAILRARSGKRVVVTVTGPLGRRIRARYGFIANRGIAVIEMAAASGLPLVESNRRNPLRASSYGTGEMIIDAVNRGVREIIIGLGGSATVDGGAGMAQALGVRFRDARGRVIRTRAAGGMLARIAAIDLATMHPGVRSTVITVAADVDNGLCGRRGAANMFGPQKGANHVMVKVLDRNLRRFANVIKRDLDIDVLNLRGGGAAGGLGAGLVAFAGARLVRGVELVARLVDFESKAATADLIITGEGRIDAQTGYGKVVAGVTSMGRRLDVPVVAIGGSLDDGSHTLFNSGIMGLASAIARDMPLAEACDRARGYITDAAERTMRLIVLGQKLKHKKTAGR